MLRAHNSSPHKGRGYEAEGQRNEGNTKRNGAQCITHGRIVAKIAKGNELFKGLKRSWLECLPLAGSTSVEIILAFASN